MIRPRPLQKRSQKRLERFLGAAKEVLNERGYSDRSISRISARAGVKPTSVYRYLHNKTAVLEMLMDEFEDGISAQIKARIMEKPSLEVFISYFLSDLQFYCSQENWIMQAQIGMRVELEMQAYHEEAIDRLADIVRIGLSNYCRFESKEDGLRVGKSIILIIETFLMALGRNILLGLTNKGLRADFEELILSQIMHLRIDSK